jgi:hypothetical protein
MLVRIVMGTHSQRFLGKVFGITKDTVHTFPGGRLASHPFLVHKMLLLSRRIATIFTGLAAAVAASISKVSVTTQSLATPPLVKPPPVAPLPDDKPKRVSAYAALRPMEPLVPWDYELPSSAPPAGYVDLAITHCGVCHSDVHQIDDAWKVASFPLVPGHEIVGTIAAVGDDAVTRAKFAVGQRACIGVQRGSCGSCACCLERLENLCPKITKTYAGSGKDKGGFANLIRFPTAWVFKAPEGMASELLGPLMCAGITTYSPLKRHGKPGAKVSEFDGF